MFESWAGEKAENVTELPPSGSYRIYYRMEGATKSALGVYNSDKKENNAFIEFSKHFLSKGLKVPEIYGNDEANDIYLIEDFGNVTLYDFLMTGREGKEFPAEAVTMYKKTLSQLVRFQIEGGSGLDYGNCYPRAAFDKQSMLWDLNYFKYYFLKLAKVPFDEQRLEDDFYRFIDYLLEEEHSYFLYRDFNHAM